MKLKVILGILLMFFVFGLAHSLEADNVIIYQNIPNPSLWFGGSETVYFVVYNNGTEPIHISNLTHYWGHSFVKFINSSFIGNDEIGYSDPSVFIDGDTVKTNLSSPITIPSKSYIEWSYTFTSYSMNFVSINSNIVVHFQDNSSSNRSDIISTVMAPAISTDFKVDNVNFSSAEGADNKIEINMPYNFTFRVSDYADTFTTMSNGNYKGNIVIRFPFEFTNISPVSGNLTCNGNVCNCSVEFYTNTPPEECVVSATPIQEGTYIIHANASQNELLFHQDSNTRSELLVKVFKPCSDILISNITTSSTNIYFGEKIIVSADVASEDPITSVIARIGDTSKVMTYQNGKYTAMIYPDVGSNSVSVKAENECGNVKILNNGIINVAPPVKPPSPAACNNITTLGLAVTPGIIDEHKLNAFIHLNYYCAKNVLGLWDYNFIFEVTYLNGSYYTINGTSVVYGVTPGKTSENVIYGISGTGYISPRFAGGSISGGGITTSSYGGYTIPTEVVPDQSSYGKVIYFDRIAVLKTDVGYKLVRVSLGVWK